MGGDTKSMNGSAKRKKANDVSPVREEDTTETDTDSMCGSNRRLKKLSASNATLTNVCVSLVDVAVVFVDCFAFFFFLFKGLLFAGSQFGEHSKNTSDKCEGK